MEIHAPPPPESRRITRRQLVLRSAAPLAVALTASGNNETDAIEVTHHRPTVAGLRHPVRVVQITDLHRSLFVSEAFIAHVVDLSIDLRPDIVLWTGDFVTGSTGYMASCARQIARLRAPLGGYAVMGNHDYWSDHNRGAREIERQLAAVGVETLTNRSVRLRNGLSVVGVDDCRTGHPDVESAFSRVRSGEPVLATTHNPTLFPRMCAHDCITLCGHTHGGQIAVPIAARALMRPMFRYLRGWYQEGEAPGRMYVSRGLGVTHLPLRLGSPPEIAVFDLVPA